MEITGRQAQIKAMKALYSLDKSYFLAITGRRRVGKTFLIDQVYQERMCYRVTGIQDGSQEAQILNFVQKLAEYSDMPIVTAPENWQQAFILFKSYLQSLPKNKKHIIFMDELPWMATPRSGFIQLLAHLWNDYLSKEKHFVLVICGSSTSWITKRIVNDKGGFHNRLTHTLALQPFTLKETKEFLLSKKIRLTDHAITELYMIMGGIPYYLENIRKGESPTVAIDRMCFSETGILRHEYDNLYKALFDNAANHEAIVKALATAKSGLTRAEIIKKSKVNAGGPYTRAMDDLLLSGFIVEETPFGRKKRGSIYRLADEYSVFFHRFISSSKKASKGIWQLISQSQKYKIWAGYAFESVCQKHIEAIKKALDISKVYTETASYRHTSQTTATGFQIDLLIDRKDKAINLCECKYHDAPIVINAKYAKQLNERKALFKSATGSKKTLFTTMITNQDIVKNEYYKDAVDTHISITALLK